MRVFYMLPREYINYPAACQVSLKYIGWYTVSRGRDETACAGVCTELWTASALVESRDSQSWLPEAARILASTAHNFERGDPLRPATAALTTPSDDDEPNTDHPTNTATMSMHTHGYIARRRSELLLDQMEANGVV